MGYDATGYLTYGPNNLCLQSETFDSATWAKALVTVTANAATAPNGTLTADRFVSAGGSFPQIAQAITVPAGNIVVSFWVQSDGTSQIAQAVIFDGVTVPFTPTSTWTQVVLSKTGSAGGSKSVVIATNNGSAAASSFYIWGAQLEAVTYQTTPSTYYPTTTAAYYGPRLVYDPVTLASLGILVEEARTNLCLQSNTLDAWTKVASTVTANAKTGPDDTASMDRFIPDTGTTGHISVSVGAASSTVYTASVYVDVATTPLDQFTVYFGHVGVVGADRTGVTVTTSGLTLADYAIGAGPAPSAKSITLVTGTIYRLVFTFTSITVASPAMVIRSGGGAADGTKGVSFGGCQLEAGTGASSAIPTTTAAVTRAADVSNNTAITLPSAYTIVAEGICPTLVSGNFPAMLGFTGSVGISVAGSNGAPGANMGGATYNTSFGALRTAGQSVNAAFRAETNNANGAGNGTLGTVDTSFTPTTGTPTNFYFGLSSSAANPWNSTISRIRIYNRALSDAQLQSLTS
jgi:hypothetical protein